MREGRQFQQNSSSPQLLSLRLVVLAVALVIAGCSRSDASGPTVTAEPGATAPAAPTAIPTEPPLPWENFTPRPSGLIDALEAGVADGSWSYEEGLISALQLLAGEVDGQSGVYAQAASLEGTGILREAQRYLQSGENAQARAEIQRLLNRIVPAPENLRAYAIARGSGILESRWPGCPGPGGNRIARLYGRKDFLTPKPGIKPVLCFKYLEQTAGKSNLQGVLSDHHAAKRVHARVRDAAMEALVKAVNGYQNPPDRLASPVLLQNIQLVFTLLDNTDPGTLASTPTSGGETLARLSSTRSPSRPMSGEGMPTVFPSVIFSRRSRMRSSTASRSGTSPNWPMHPGPSRTGGRRAALNTFGNVIYPQVNAEHNFIGDWAVNSATLPLTEMSYENFGFFQYLGNTIGNNAILDLINTMPVSGGLGGSTRAAGKIRQHRHPV